MKIKRLRKSVDMSSDLLSAQRDRRQRILDLMRNSARHFLPRRLLLRPQQLCGVLKHNHVSLVLAPHALIADGRLQ